MQTTLAVSRIVSLLSHVHTHTHTHTHTDTIILFCCLIMNTIDYDTRWATVDGCDGTPHMKPVIRLNHRSSVTEPRKTLPFGGPNIVRATITILRGNRVVSASPNCSNGPWHGCDYLVPDDVNAFQVALGNRRPLKLHAAMSCR